MLTEICAELQNYFCRQDDIHFGKFEISGGSIAPLDFLKNGQYFRIVGSTFNDGVYRYPTHELSDELFEGSVWAMAVPPSVIALAEEIQVYEQSEAAKPSAYTSETFGGYSYTKAASQSGAPMSWKDVFAAKLRPYRRISVI